MRYRVLLSLFMSAFLLMSCSSNDYEKLEISTTTWIGYTPLFYAKEKGWLKPLKIKLQHVSSLSENLYLYDAGNSDAYAGTQYEYKLLVNKKPTLMPIILFDRSNGGDVVMSNLTISQLEKKDEIDVYLEMDSINKTIFEDFVKAYNLQNKKINYINNDQAAIAELDVTNLTKPTIIVTYTPYNIKLKKHGFKSIASTKDSLKLLVLDALYTTQETYFKHEEQFKELKKLIDTSIEVLEKNPKEYYKGIKPYILDLTYDEFTKTVSDIVWINKDISKTLKARMKAAHFPSSGLL
ncbi:hypothetical protein GJV85_04830 [Sulfurimonas aquatica]|uniref:SsuA/THI5-like domain-containing protein n=1 Tax=Sulfurimonas aquatica TaxID=2672570 RepID=A0A975AZJ7_9BACT|nr:hypothetical protein [Sulfurimonas aquatica]QSZ41459.1 hypothetical protein GJV85_04830 [Sulfurimonas aquatica]